MVGLFPRARAVSSTAFSTLRKRSSLALPLVLAAAVTASASGYHLIRIRPGDTLSGIAARYHTTVSRLVALNDLPGNGDLIIAGNTLRIPGAGGRSGTGHAGRSPRRTVVSQYTVTSGDSVYGLAARFHVSARSIIRHNRLPSSLTIVIGQRLAIPHHVRVHHSAPPAPSGSPSVARDRSILWRHSEPSRDQVAAMIRSTAAQWGLDPRLALAISWQESGFNMRVVSPVDAIGAMQIMPYTGTYLSNYVVHRQLNLYDAQDNVTAGVALLSVLMREAHDERIAAAGYYQGLASVRSRGMFTDTKQYVANVMALQGRF